MLYTVDSIIGSTTATWNQTIQACPDGFNPGEFAVQTCFLGRYGQEIGSDQFGATIMASASADSSDGIQRAILRLSNIQVNHLLRSYKEVYRDLLLCQLGVQCWSSLPSRSLPSSFPYESKYELVIHQIVVYLSDIQSSSEHPCYSLRYRGKQCHL